MKYTIEELKQILKEIGSSGRVDLKCSYCGKITNKRARYVRESINKSEDGFCIYFVAMFAITSIKSILILPVEIVVKIYTF